MPILKGAKVSLSYVQCFLFLVSSSINVFIFIVHGWIPSGQASYTLYGFSAAAVTNCHTLGALKQCK